MGTFLNYYGDMKIPENKLEEYIEKVKKILTYGGMVQFETVKLFDKEIALIKTPTENNDGRIRFHYNVIGDEAWETASFNTKTGCFNTNKVGWAEFNWVCSAVYVLTEFFTDSFGLAACNGDIYDATEIIGWLNYIFDENYTNERIYDFWKIYELIHEDGYQDILQIFNSLSNSTEINTRLSTIVSAAYIDRENSSLWDMFKEGCKDAENNFNLIKMTEKSYSLIEKLKEQGKTYEEILAFTILEDEKIQEILHDANHELNLLAFITLLLPTVITLKNLCEIYEKDFWEEYYKNKDNINFNRGDFWDKDTLKDDKIIDKNKTANFLDISDNALCFWKTKFPKNYHKTDDDLSYFWTKDSDINFSDEFNVWCQELKKEFDKINNEYYELLETFDYTKKILDTLNYANEYYKRIFAYKEMFYDFLGNSQTKEYQSALKLFEKILEDNKEDGKIIEECNSWDIEDKNITFNKGRLNVKRFLSIMANKELRKKIFNF